MAGGRNTPPLFDLLPKTPGGTDAAAPKGTAADASRVGPEKPTVRVDLVAQPHRPRAEPPAAAQAAPMAPAAVAAAAPAAAGAPSGVGGSGAGSSGVVGGGGMSRAMEPLMAGPTVVVPRNAILVGIAVLILVGIGLWTLGVWYGEAQEKKAIAREFGSATPPILDPLVQGDTAAPGTGTDRSSQTGRRTAPGTGPGGGQSTGPAAAQRGGQPGGQTGVQTGGQGGGAPAVSPGSDPRVAGLNYYAVVLVPRDKAEEIVEFFSQNGVQSFAVPERVDSGGRAANNDDPSGVSYRVFLLPGITGEEYRKNDRKRAQVESDVARLAEVWKRERRTGNLVAQPGWYKYNR